MSRALDTQQLLGVGIVSCVKLKYWRCLSVKGTSCACINVYPWGVVLPTLIFTSSYLTKLGKSKLRYLHVEFLPSANNIKCI